MIKFINKIILFFVLLIGISSLYLILIILRPELVYNFYYRFTTDKASSLILGTSRSAQGIKPDIISKNLLNQNNEIINHSFAIGPSSYGPNYFREIKNKLNRDPKANGLFILSVDPWSLATDSTNFSDDTSSFFEIRKNLFVGNLKNSSINPNYEYLWRYWTNKFSPLENLFKHIIGYNRLIELHADGWLEVNINLDSIKNSSLKIFPNIIAPPKWMSLTTDFVGPKPVIDLHAAGLKVSEGMLKAKLLGLNDDDFKIYMESNYPALAFETEDYL